MSAAALTAPRHSRGGAGGAVLARRPSQRAKQMVDIPERIYRGSHYSDVFVKAWAKIAALDTDNNIEHCNARVTELARFTGLSVRDTERALTEGRHPGPDGGPPEFDTRRMTRKTGTGRSAIRQARPVTTSERSLRVPVAMCDALTPRQLRAALLAAHAAADGHVFTAAELAGELFHHHGDNKGQPLNERTARRLVKQIEDLGWADVGHRAGHQGRNTVTLNAHPLHPAPPLDTPAEPPPGQPAGDASADIHGGSGPVICGGSLAIKEYRQVDTDGVTQAGGGIRRRRSDRKWVAAPVDNSVPDTFASGDRVLRTDTHTPTSSTIADRAPYTGPGLQLSPRVWRVLAPVHHELPAIRPYLLRKIAHAIGAQLDTAAPEERLEERLIDRLTRRYATTTTVRDIGRWILGAALIRHGCGHPDCETGTVWSTGDDCQICALNRQTATARTLRDAELAAHARHFTQQRQQTRPAAEDQEQQRPAPASVHEQQRPAPASVHEQLLADPGDTARPAPAASADVVPLVPWPARASEAERSTASPTDIRTAIARYGRTGAIHIYGHALALPRLAELPETGCGRTDRRTDYAQ